MKTINPNISCTDNCLLGDRINISFKIDGLKADSKIVCQLPYKVGELGENGLVLSKDKFVVADTLNFEFISYKAGLINISPIYANIDGLDYSSQNIELNIKSLGEEQELQEIVPPQKIYPSFWYYFSAVSIVLLVLLIIYILINKIKPKKKITSEIYIAPFDLALRKLREIEFDKKLKSNLKNYISAITETLKSYIERDYSIDVLDLTTTEFVTKLKNEKIFDSDKIVLIKNFFKNSDLIKFKEKYDFNNDNDFISKAKELLYLIKKEDTNHEI